MKDGDLVNLEEKLKKETSLPKKIEILIEISKRHLRSDLKLAKYFATQAIALAKRGKERKSFGEALNFYANILRIEGNMGEALSFAQKALKVGEMENNKSIKATAYQILGLIHQANGDFEKALTCHKEALLLYQAQNDELGLAIAYNNLSLVHWYKGELAEALEYQKKSLAIKEARGESAAVAVSRLNMGVIYEDMGEWESATECFYRALVEKEKIKDCAGIALCYNNIGEIYLKRGKLDKAITLFETAISYSEKIGSLPRKAEALGNLGEANFLMGNFLRAMNLYVEAMEICTKINQKDELAKTYRRMGELLLRSQEIKEAQEFLTKALSLALETGIKKEEGNVRKALGNLYWALGEKETAKKYFQESCEVFRNLGIRYELGKAYLEYGKFLVENYAKNIGLPYLNEAKTIFKNLEIFQEGEELEKYLYRLEREENKGVALLRSLSTICANPAPLTDFCRKCLSLLKEILLLEGCAIRIDSHHLTLGTIEEAEAVAIPLSSGREKLGILYLKFPTPAPISLSETIKEAVANIIALGLEKAKSQAIPKPIELETEKEIPFEGIIGKTAKMREVFAIIKKVAPTKVSILIQGESGTGKELIARCIHNLSFGPDKPFVAINCAAIPETLLESELFGVEKGTATGVTEKKGKFELASGGTIFLDEIGDMTLSLQAKILRVLQEKKFEKVGGRKTIETDVRIIAATNQDLEKNVKEGKFREDLLYRLNVVSLSLPPLRERKEDIPLLVDYFIKKYNNEFQKSCQGVTEEVMDKFFRYHWPGNIRELENVLERAIILAQGEVITNSDLPPHLQFLPQEDKRPELKAIKTKVKKEIGESEREIILNTLQTNQWDITKSAQKLGISRRHLYRLMAKYGLKRPP
ncbi:MAG: sigma 54-interacting transcriptional regulator [candidate division WOR-3 bacterium]